MSPICWDLARFHRPRRSAPYLKYDSVPATESWGYAMRPKCRTKRVLVLVVAGIFAAVHFSLATVPAQFSLDKSTPVLKEEHADREQLKMQYTLKTLQWRNLRLVYLLWWAKITKAYISVVNMPQVLWWTKTTEEYIHVVNMPQNCALSDSGGAGGYPRVIHQVARNVVLDPPWDKLQERWKEMNPGWKYRIWTDDTMRELIISDFPWFLSQYDRYIYPIQRARGQV